MEELIDLKSPSLKLTVAQRNQTLLKEKEFAEKGREVRGMNLPARQVPIWFDTFDWSKSPFFFRVLDQVADSCTPTMSNVSVRRI